MICALLYATYAIDLAQKELDTWANVRKQGAIYSTARISRVHSDFCILLYRRRISLDHGVANEAANHIRRVYSLMAKNSLGRRPS